MKQEDYDRVFEFNRQEEDNWLTKKVKNFGAVFSRSGFKKAVFRRIPFLRWTSQYQKKNLGSDIIAGITMGIYNVPQAMSYSTLAGLPPVYGLYASFFPPLLYAIFGTATHTSIGVFSVTCLMINKCVQKMMAYEHENSKFPNLTQVGTVTSLCILTGLIQSVMAIVRCDKLMKFLSAPAISAITFSACFFGIVQQIPKLCGFSVPRRSYKYFNLGYQIFDIFDNVHKSNPTTLIVSACALIILIGSKCFIEPKLKQYPSLKPWPFPKELIVILLSTLASHYMQLEKKYGVKTIHQIPSGFPEPEIPRVDLWPYIVSDAISLAIVAYAVTISMGQIFSKKHKYKLDCNQELLALGLVNIGSSFFATFPTSASLSRTLINEESGAKTQLSGIVSSFCILLVITFVGPYMASLPSCVLAAIVLVVVKTLLFNYQDLPKLWRYSKHDFYTWIITAIVTLCSDIAEGVAAGIFFAILTIAIQSQQPTIKKLGQVRPNDFRPINHYSTAKKTDFWIIRFDAPLIFANVDKFLDNVKDAVEETRGRRSASVESQEDHDWTALILDCHTWTYTDSMGISAVKEIDEDLKSRHVLLLLANLKSSLRRQYEEAGVLKQILPLQIYPSIQDALDSAHELVDNQKSFFELEKV